MMLIQFRGHLDITAREAGQGRLIIADAGVRVE
jgi:hypothetical protein